MNKHSSVANVKYVLHITHYIRVYGMETVAEYKLYAWGLDRYF